MASHFRSLHKPGDPLVLTNVYDAASASAILSLPTTKAIATSSHAVAACQGVEDEDMTFEQNLAAVTNIARVVVPAGVPLTVDAQDGYGDRLEEFIEAIIKLGAVGCNLEDPDKETGKLRPLSEAVERVRRVMETARRCGVPGFAVNARTDVLTYEGLGIEDAVERGKAYLDAGACTVFVWGGMGGRGLSGKEVQRVVSELGGRVSVLLKLGEGFLMVGQVRKLGVARISVGSGLFRVALKAFKDAAETTIST